ncbi:MAG: FecR family protein [Roseibium sp.]
MFTHWTKSRFLGVLFSVGWFIVCDFPGWQKFAAATEVGVAAAVNSDAFGTPPGGARNTKILGDNVIYNERIETGGSGLVQVLLVDGSTFTVGSNSDLVIDEFVYDPDSGSGKLVTTFSKGVVRFVGGRLSKKRGGVTVNTPVGTIGIRGGIANLNLGTDPWVFSLLFGKDLTITGPDGQVYRIHQAGYTLTIGPNGELEIRKTTQADLAAAQAGLTNPAQNGGSQNPPTNNQIAGSGLPGVNSNLGGANAPPPSKPSPVESTLLRDVDGNIIQIPQATQDRLRNILENSQDNSSSMGSGSGSGGGGSGSGSGGGGGGSPDYGL